MQRIDDGEDDDIMDRQLSGSELERKGRSGTQLKSVATSHMSLTIGDRSLSIKKNDPFSLGKSQSNVEHLSKSIAKNDDDEEEDILR